MKHSVDKCKVIHFGKNSSGIKDTMYGKPLEEVSSGKDSGVVVSKDLKVGKHCEEAYSKASQMLRLHSTPPLHLQGGPLSHSAKAT